MASRCSGVSRSSRSAHTSGTPQVGACPSRRAYLPHGAIDDAARAYETGASIRGCAQRLMVSYKAARTALLDAGVTLRPQGARLRVPGDAGSPARGTGRPVTTTGYVLLATRNLDRAYADVVEIHRNLEDARATRADILVQSTDGELGCYGQLDVYALVPVPPAVEEEVTNG